MTGAQQQAVAAVNVTGEEYRLRLGTTYRYARRTVIACYKSPSLRVAYEIMADELLLLRRRRRWRRRRNSGHWGPTCAATNNYCFGARRRQRWRQFAPSQIKKPKCSALPKRRTRTIVKTNNNNINQRHRRTGHHLHQTEVRI